MPNNNIVHLPAVILKTRNIKFKVLEFRHRSFFIYVYRLNENPKITVRYMPTIRSNVLFMDKLKINWPQTVFPKCPHPFHLN